MKTNMKAFAMIALALIVSLNAEAKKKPAKKAKSAPTQHISMGANPGAGPGIGKKIGSSSHSGPVSTDVVFDGSMINGRYHTAGEAVTTVETEKKMNELVGFRRDFKDRLVVERARLNGQ